MADVAEIKQYLSIPDADVKQDAFIAECLAVAVALVDNFVGDALVPAEPLELAYTIVAADLFNRRKAPNGIVNQQFIGADGVTTGGMRIARDPLAGVYGLLGRWVMTW